MQSFASWGNVIEGFLKKIILIVLIEPELLKMLDVKVYKEYETGSLKFTQIN